VTLLYEWTNFVRQIVIISQSNPLNWCWYSNSRKKNWKDNGVGYGVVKIFLRSWLAVVKVLIFPRSGRETQRNPHFSWKFSQIVCGRVFSWHLQRKIRGKCEKISFNCRSCSMFWRAARRYRPCNIELACDRFFSTSAIPLMCSEIEMLFRVDWTFDDVTKSGRSTTRPVPVMKSNNSTIVLYRKQVAEGQLRALLLLVLKTKMLRE